MTAGNGPKGRRSPGTRPGKRKVTEKDMEAARAAVRDWESFVKRVVELQEKQHRSVEEAKRASRSKSGFELSFPYKEKVWHEDLRRFREFAPDLLNMIRDGKVDPRLCHGFVFGVLCRLGNDGQVRLMVDLCVHEDHFRGFRENSLVCAGGSTTTSILHIVTASGSTTITRSGGDPFTFRIPNSTKEGIDGNSKSQSKKSLPTRAGGLPEAIPEETTRDSARAIRRDRATAENVLLTAFGKWSLETTGEPRWADLGRLVAAYRQWKSSPVKNPETVVAAQWRRGKLENQMKIRVRRALQSKKVQRGVARYLTHFKDGKAPIALRSSL